MSCWCRTMVLRIPAKSLGFKYKREWDEFLNKHEEDFNWEPGYFAEALCDDYMEWFDGCHDYRYSQDPETLLPEPDGRYYAL